MTVFVQSVVFDAEGVEIVWGSETDMMDNGLRVFRTAVVPRALVADQLGDLIEAAEAIVDQIGIIQRAPENSFRRSR